jgi:putative glutamine amidotransferase
MINIKKPLIGVIPDFRVGCEDSYSKRPFYAVRQNYLDCIAKSGALSVTMPYDYDAIDEYLDLVDGLLLIGGGFDINPARYGQEIHSKTALNKARDEFEYEAVNKVVKQKPKMPIFGICNGMQLINVFFGGSCIQHIPDFTQYMDHEQSNDKNYDDYSQPYHDVDIKEGTKIFKIGGQNKISPNSSHHQAVDRLGENIIVSANASDGIVEAIEHKDHPFCLGVQWHPEYDSNEIDKKLFAEFVSQSLIYKNGK